MTELISSNAIEFYQANKLILESVDCMEAHEYVNSHCIDTTEYIQKCQTLIIASTLTRETLITILSANDRHGIYSDERSIAEEMPIATKADLLMSIVLTEIEL
jgi:hypothetical protein